MDIFGNRKLLEEIERLEQNITSLQKFNGDQFIKVFDRQFDLSDKLNKLIDVVDNLSDKFYKLIEELKKVQAMAEIPMVKPRLRNPEDVYKKEKAQESEFTNLFRL